MFLRSLSKLGAAILAAVIVVCISGCSSEPEKAPQGKTSTGAMEKGKMEGTEKSKMEGTEKGKMEGMEKGKMEGTEKGKMEGTEKSKM
jgi:hypothetical protein